MTQEAALYYMQSGHNVFLTGAPGTGKTYVLQQYIDYLKKNGVKPTILAPTGIAASHIGGNTIHSFFGIGLKEALSAYELEALSEKKYIWDRIKKLKVLIIDEVSMLSPALFRTMDLILRTFKFSMEPFGGVQVILSGDFFQLPPIQKGSQGEKFIFQTQLWEDLQLRVIALERSYRHDDEKILSLLQAMRERTLGEEHRVMLKERMYRDAETVTSRLYTHNIDVDRVNEASLDAIDAPPHIYEAKTKGAKKWLEKIYQTSLLLPQLTLKKGALVFFIRNNKDKGYINGTLGTVIDFDKQNNPIVETFSGDIITAEREKWEFKDMDGKVLAQVMQIPLRLAWAITVHKSQGMTLDAAEIDLSKSFAAGQGYVALSRIRSLDGLYLKGVNRIAFQVDDDAFQQEKKMKELSRALHADFVQKAKEEIDEKIEAFMRKIGGK